MPSMMRLLFIVGLIVFAGCGPATALQTPTTDAPVQPTSTAGSLAAATATAAVPAVPTASSTVPTPAATTLPTSTPGPQCILPPEFTRPVTRNITVSGTQGDEITIGADELFQLPSAASEFLWAQLHAAQDSFDYTTHNVAELPTPTDRQLVFTPSRPGVYRFVLTVSTFSGAQHHFEVDVEVKPAESERFEFRAISFPDLFGNNGGPGFDINPDDPECRDIALDHALSAAMRDNANWITVVPAQFMTRADPSPLWGARYEDLSLTDDDFYEALIDAAHARGLKVMQAEQDAPDFTLPAGQWHKPELLQTPEYWEGWFDEWQDWAVERAARAEAFGVDMFAPFVWASDTFHPDVYPDYDRRWREMVAAIREVFSGEVGMVLSPYGLEHMSFTDAVDVVLVSLDAGGLKHPAFVADESNPKMAEIETALEQKMAVARNVLAESGVPVYFMLHANSSDRQVASEDPEVLKTILPDFQEQSLYFETMLQGIDAEPWITGALAGIFDWFDQMARPADEIYFDQTFQASPRSKPAEDVFKLWFSD